MNIPLNIDWQQILLHALNFVILVGGLYFLLYKPVKKFMAQREAHYRTMDEQAKQALREAEQLKADYQNQLGATDTEISRKKTQAQQEVEQSVQQQLADARTQADKIVADAQKAADRAHEKMLTEAQKELTDLAVEATKKLLFKENGDAYDQFLKLAERGERHA